MRAALRILPVLAVGAFFADSAAALPTTYFMMSGSRMSALILACSPCTVPVTGYVTLDDDGAGNVALIDMNLAHDAYDVGSPGFTSIVLERDSITLAAGSVAGIGSTLESVAFGPTALANVGTLTCTSAPYPCSILLGFADGTYPLPSPVAVDLGTWTFDELGGLSASFVYTLLSGGATETLHLVGSGAAIPEPGTGLLAAAGLAGLSRWRRARLDPER